MQQGFQSDIKYWQGFNLILKSIKKGYMENNMENNTFFFTFLFFKHTVINYWKKKKKRFEVHIFFMYETEKVKYRLSRGLRSFYSDQQTNITNLVLHQKEIFVSMVERHMDKMWFSQYF